MPMPYLENRPAPLEPPRFRLRTLLVGVGLFGLLMAVLLALDPYGMFATILLVLSVTAHVVGTTLGHRLRAKASVAPLAPGETRYPAVASDQFAPTTRLSQRRDPGRLILGMTIAWAVVGGGVGAALLLTLNGERSNLVNVGSGALAFALLGAVWGFAVASFVKELLAAMWQAHGDK